MQKSCCSNGYGGRYSGNFDNLHPEYEIYDWNRKSQFLDFAFLTPLGRFGIECDGYQSHIKDMDREKFGLRLEPRYVPHRNGVDDDSFLLR